MGGRLRVTHLFSRLEEVNPELLKNKHEFEEFEIGRFDEEFFAKRPNALPSPSKEADAPRTSIVMCGTWDFERSVRATMFLSGFSTDDLIRIPG